MTSFLLLAGPLAVALGCLYWVLSFSKEQERVTAERAPRHIAGLLQLAADDPVLLLERRATAQGRPVEWRETHVRADRFSLEAQWTTAGSTLSAAVEGIARP